MEEIIPKRRCSKCGVPKPETDAEFRRRSDRPELFQAQCRGCQRNQTRMWAMRNPEKTTAIRRKSRLKTRYGLTIEDFDLIMAAQGGVCAICGVDEPGCRGWCVDHAHTAQKTVRGILCSLCNTSLPLAEDPERLEAAIRYLKRPPTTGIFDVDGRGLLRYFVG